MNNYYCSRCGYNFVINKYDYCQSCKDSDLENAKGWQELKCWCGKQAYGYNIFGGFCCSDHYPNKYNSNSIIFKNNAIVGVII